MPPGACLEALLGRYVTNTSGQVRGSPASLFLAPGMQPAEHRYHRYHPQIDWSAVDGQHIDVMAGIRQCYGR